MKVLIADDHAIVRGGLKQIVKRIKDVSTIDEAEEGYEALAKIEGNMYDLVILDIHMPGLSGFDILKILQDRNEKANVLILSIHPQEQYAVRALHLGASGYLCKDCIYDELESAINKIIEEHKYISTSLVEKIVFDKKGDITKFSHERLSEREFQIMCMLARGISVKEIAAELFISDKTVSTYRYRIFAKMRISKYTDLTLYALRNRLIE
jgi:two-component system, NarL family, invasion response regulator UvrY